MQIKQLIKQRGYTQKQFADKLGISLSALNQRLYGNPSLSSLQEIASVLNVPISQLFADESENTVRCPNCGTELQLKKRDNK